MKVWFEDYRPGEEMRSPYIRLRQDAVYTYARFTHDLRPVLIADPTDLSAEEFVPPLYLLSVGMCLLQHAPGHNYVADKVVAFMGFETVEFPNPGRFGDLIHSIGVVEEVRRRGDRGEVIYWHETLNQDGEPVVTSRHGMLLESEEAGN